MHASYADQIVEATEEAARLVPPGNAALTEDRIVNEVVEFAANGRHSDAFDVLVGEPVEARVRVLPAPASLPARYPHEPRPADDRSSCDRCTRRWNRKTGKQAQHAIWIAAGTAVVELVVCPECRSQLNGDFPGQLTWREA